MKLNDYIKRLEKLRDAGHGDVELFVRYGPEGAYREPAPAPKVVKRPGLCPVSGLRINGGKPFVQIKLEEA